MDYQQGTQKIIRWIPDKLIILIMNLDHTIVVVIVVAMVCDSGCNTSCEITEKSMFLFGASITR